MPYKDPEKRKEAGRLHYKRNKKEVCARTNKYYWDNLEKARAQRRKYKKEYDKHHKAERNIYEKNRRKTDLQHRLACNLRERLRDVLRRNNKNMTDHEYNRKYYQEHKKYLLEQVRKYQREHKKEISEYYFKSKERLKIYQREHKKEISEYARLKRKTDIQYKLKSNLRRRLREVLKRKTKPGSAVKDLGCSIKYLKKHLELQFSSGMSWNNWGNKEGDWSIDHIKPLSKFDLTDREQFLEACHYTNLQPMWHVENMMKGNR